MVIPAENAAGKVSDYIQTMPEWSKNILLKLREIIMNAGLSLVEDWKWGPNYSCAGMVCGFSAFQKYVKVTFFNGSAMKDAGRLFNHCVDNQFSRSIKYTDILQVDEQLLTAYLKESVAINQRGFKREIKDKTVQVPVELQQNFSRNKQASLFFEALSYGYRKEFVEYITTAKLAATRAARIAKVVDCCARGKKLNDKYKVAVKRSA